MSACTRQRPAASPTAPGILVGVREVTDAEYRECANAVLRLYGSVEGHFEVKPENVVKFQASFPLAMYALNQVHAALMLAERNRSYLAVANVRVAYEHAVTAQWVLFTEGAEERLVGSVNRHTRQVVDMLASHATIPDELHDGFGQAGDPTMPSVETRCRDLDSDTDSLYYFYRVLSEAVHPSVATLLQHLKFDQDRNISGVNFGANHEPPPDMWMVCALSAISAAFTIEAQRKDQPRTQQVLELATKCQLPFDLSAK